MIAGQYHPPVEVNGRAYTLQELVNLVAERDELRERFVVLGQLYYNPDKLIDQWAQLRRMIDSARQTVHVVHTIPVKPGTACYSSCGRCLADRLWAVIDA
jgi:2-iminoacetate synthase ThiH